MENIEKNASEKLDFEVPSAEDIVVNLCYWLDMAKLRTNDYLRSKYGSVSESVGDSESEV